MARRADAAARLDPLFRPRSVAIVGASATPFKHGNVALNYLLAGGFRGAVYPVNAAGGEIAGLPAYRSLREIPGPVDCAFLLIPAGAVNAALRDCAATGVRAVVIGSSGFAEQGTQAGRALQSEMTRIAEAAGLAILGPNTNGLWNASHNLSLGYNASHGDAMLPGTVSVAAHSGALMDSLAPALRRFGAGLCKYAPVGNEANVDLNDVFEYLIGDADTRVIGLIVERIGEGPRFRALAQKARAAGKPVIALKLGRSSAGAAAALAHASRLAGSARAHDAFLRGCGVQQVSSVEALAGACALLADGAPGPVAGDAGLAGVSSSGGGAELLADFAEEYGVPLAGDGAGRWPANVDAAFAAVAGSGLVRNPADAGNLGGVGNIELLLREAEKAGCNGPALLYAHRLPQEARDLRVAEIMIARRDRAGTPAICLSPGGLRESVAEFYRRHGAPVFGDTASCFEALRCWYGARAERAGDDPVPGLDAARRTRLARLLDAAGGRTLLTEIDSAALLAAAGVDMVASTEVASPAQAAAHMRPGERLALKCVAPGVAHKNDAGLVAVGLASADDIAAAWARMEASLAAAGHAREDCRFILQPMLSARVELIAGVAHEPPLGHFLVAGLGGLLAEALDEVVLIAIPSSRAAIETALRESRLAGVLARLDRDGAPAASGLCDTLCALQALTLAFPDKIRSIDVNPLMISNDRCAAVDALAELHPHPGD